MFYFVFENLWLMRDFFVLSSADISDKLRYDKWTRHEVHANFVVNSRG